MANEAIRIKIRELVRGMTPYDRWIMEYRMWIEDDPWCWEYRLIHGEE